MSPTTYQAHDMPDPGDPAMSKTDMIAALVEVTEPCVCAHVHMCSPTVIRRS